MNILVIDGMGGGVGRAVIERIRACSRDNAEEYYITAVGTNAIASAAMHKAGANAAATGENAAVFNCSNGSADCVIGTVGIVLANAMLGEISPRIAEAVSSCAAVKILIPTSKCNVAITGVKDMSLTQYIDEIPSILRKFENEKSEK